MIQSKALKVFHSEITARDINLKYDLNVNVRRFFTKVMFINAYLMTS
jgi:hypothetical protein